MLLEKIEYSVERTRMGTWRRFVYPTGARFAEFRSHASLLGLPCIHYTFGICPETGKRIVAKGVCAIGRIAVGIFTLGQVSAGVIAVGQLAVGLILALGQGALGTYCAGQIALGVAFGLGQLATGRTVIAQIGFGTHVLALIGFGTHVWSMKEASPEAVEYFTALWKQLVSITGAR